MHLHDGEAIVGTGHFHLAHDQRGDERKVAVGVRKTSSTQKDQSRRRGV